MFEKIKSNKIRYSKNCLLNHNTSSSFGYFFAMENKIKPMPNMIRVIGQGRGSPRGLGLFIIINIESPTRRNPDMTKHIFDIFNIIIPLFRILMDKVIFYEYNFTCCR
jgi:hypothetical protein